MVNPKSADQLDHHHMGTGVGAGGGAVAGAALGAAGGPVGMAAGAVIGAAAGSVAGKGVSQVVNPQAEDDYWSASYATSRYVTSGQTYDDYRPAYRLGYNRRASTRGTFDAAEGQMATRAGARSKGRRDSRGSKPSSPLATRGIG